MEREGLVTSWMRLNWLSVEPVKTPLLPAPQSLIGIDFVRLWKELRKEMRVPKIELRMLRYLLKLSSWISLFETFQIIFHFIQHLLYFYLFVGRPCFNKVDFPEVEIEGIEIEIYMVEDFLWINCLTKIENNFPNRFRIDPSSVFDMYGYNALDKNIL